MSSRKQCRGRVCGPEVPAANLPPGTKGKMYFGVQCQKYCQDPTSPFCTTCEKARLRLLEGSRKIGNITFKGEYLGPQEPGSRILRNIQASELSAATEAATLAAVAASDAATYSSNVAAAVSGMGGTEATAAKKAAGEAKKAARVAVQRAKTAAEIEAEALAAQLKAAKERAAAERAAEAAAKKAANEAAAAAKKALLEAEKAAKKSESALKNTTRKTEKKSAKKSTTRKNRRGSNASFASGASSPNRSPYVARSGYATPYSGSPGSNAYTYNLVRVPRPAKLNTAGGSTGFGAASMLAMKAPNPKQNVTAAAGGSEEYTETNYF